MITEKKPVPPPSGEGKPQTCPECSGRGWTDNLCVMEEHDYRCSYCDGKGFGAGGKECYACHGTGRIEVRKTEKIVCPLCHGAGVYPVPASMTASEFAFHPSHTQK
ncbi:MAG: hypothetical protein FJY66_02230 [Calditrichaeota bacterium]|nr:hypothetical protein [Calditrichota bacterium]